MNSDIYRVEAVFSRSQVLDFLKKKKQKIDKLEKVYLPYRLYIYRIELKRFLVKAKVIKSVVLLNGVTGQCSPAQFDYSELIQGKPEEGKCLNSKPDLDQYHEKCEATVFFNLMKRYFLITKPKIELQQIIYVYYPFWRFATDRYVNARRLVIEEILI